MYQKQYKYARCVAQLLVGTYMRIHLGIIRNDTEYSLCFECVKVCPKDAL